MEMINILIVDDQEEVVRSLKNGILWEKLSVKSVYTACSAQEARLILANFPIDVIISDIEMPEEDGLSLCKWAKERFGNIECIFLTSHADFSYAKIALQIGGFDYILQPVKYSAVEEVIGRVTKKIKRNQKVQKIIDTQQIVLAQRNDFLDGILNKIADNKEQEAQALYEKFCEMYRAEFREGTAFPLLVKIIKWNRLNNIWDEALVRHTIINILEELFARQNAKIGISSLDEDFYCVFVILEKEDFEEENFIANIHSFYDFVDQKLDFKIAVYHAVPGLSNNIVSMIKHLIKSIRDNDGSGKGVHYVDMDSELQTRDQTVEDDPVDMAVSYIQKNINHNISRTEVAEYVHLNEEYFSRLFRQRAGLTFKDYVLQQKMAKAKELLANSHLSVSIIASKVGYDNFSHFSRMFKSVTKTTPQEYRKKFNS